MNLHHAPFPIININEQYYLREQRLTDSANFLEYYSNPEVCQFILASIPSNLQEAEQEIQYCRALFYNQKGIYWAIATHKEDQMIGAIGLYISSTELAEICYDLNKSYWNQGVMTSAMRCAIDCIFNNTTLTKLTALTMKSNTASTCLLEKLGFQHSETLKKHRLYKGIFHDVEKYELEK